MTDAAIISQAKDLARETTTAEDTKLLAWLNRIQRSYARRDDWPQLRVLNATLTTAANTQAYDLPATFDRLMSTTLMFNPTTITGGYQNGSVIQVLDGGDPRLDGWNYAGSAATPLAAAISSKAGTPGALQMLLYPFPTAGSQTIVYSYYRTPTALVNAPTLIDVDALAETFIYELAAEMETFNNQLDRATYFKRQARMEYNMARRAQMST